MLHTTLLVHGSPEHVAALELRRKVLREPLGLEGPSPRELEEERNTVLWGCFAADGNLSQPGRLIATLLLQQRGPSAVQMRQVAVATEWQRRGVGRGLVDSAESWCRRATNIDAPCRLFAHAREEALPFYRRLGYSVVGEPFVEVGIRHHCVEKLLWGTRPPR